MDRCLARLDFAAIGHQESWQKIAALVNYIRTADQGKLPCEKIKDIFPFIPPRELFRIKVRSKTGAEINGAYIETFIDPDTLCIASGRANIHKVMGALSRAKKLGSSMVSLGGFTSIVLEGNLDSFSTAETSFTTGNTLTAAFIAKGIEQAATQLRINLSEASMLIIGATGDIGTACSQYFKRTVKKLLLCARNYPRLAKISNDLLNQGVAVAYSVNLDDLNPHADIVICVASSSEIKLRGCRKGTLICDAGYPKNLDQQFIEKDDIHLFHGGMGQVSAGFDFVPDYSKTMYTYGAPFVVHGCVLESIVLAFEHRYENYSSARGKITVAKMEEIYRISLAHGIYLAPFYNAKGLW